MGALFGAVGVGWVVARQVESPAQVASRAAPPEASWITATVEERVLAQTVILRGDVRPEVSVAVGVPSSVEGAAVVTNIGARAGADVLEGGRVVEVSGRPVFVLAGTVPVYRSLKPGMSGADVAQLQAALTRLGYAPETDGTFGELTKVAVRDFYAAAGYEAVPTSETVDADVAAATLALDEAEAAFGDAEAALTKSGDASGSAAVVGAQAELDAATRAATDAESAADAAVVVAQQQQDAAIAQRDRVLAAAEATAQERDEAALAVTQAQTAREAAEREGDASIAAARDRVKVARAALDDARAAGDVDAATRARDNARTARDNAAVALWTIVTTSGPTVPQGEVVFTPTLPARVQSTTAGLGPLDGAAPTDGAAPAPAGAALMTLAGGALVVDVAVRAAEQGLVRPGMTVELLDEQTDTPYAATIASVAADAVTGADGQLGYPAVLTPSAALPVQLAGVNLRVTITAASTETATLVVPLAAVSSATDGATRVSVLRADATEPADVPVTAGLSADGFVSVVPVDAGALRVGDRVVVGR